MEEAGLWRVALVDDMELWDEHGDLRGVALAECSDKPFAPTFNAHKQQRYSQGQAYASRGYSHHDECLW